MTASESSIPARENSHASLAEASPPAGDFTRLVTAESASGLEGRKRAGSGILLGELVAWSPSTGARVDYPGNEAGPLSAQSLVPLKAADVGARLALTLPENAGGQVLILGRIETPATDETVDVTADGQRVQLTAEKEIVLRCGKASITLTRAGKIILRGTYLLNRSSGVNRIKGGSVQIN
jgi:hypothetical protein